MISNGGLFDGKKFPEPFLKFPFKILFFKTFATITTIIIPLVLQQVSNIISPDSLILPIVIFCSLVGSSFWFQVSMEKQLNSHKIKTKRNLCELIVTKLSCQNKDYPLWNMLTGELPIYISNYYDSFLCVVFQTIKVIFIIVYLYIQLGAILLIGLAVCFLIMFSTFSLADKIQYYLNKNNEVRENKLHIFKEFLQRVVDYKMMWLDSWVDNKISQQQLEYMNNLKKNKMIDCWCVGLWQFTSIGISAIVLTLYYSFYIQQSHENSLHPPTIIYYFSILNFPLNALSWNLAGLKNSIRAIKQIQKQLAKSSMNINKLPSLQKIDNSMINKACTQLQFMKQNRIIQLKVPIFQLKSQSIYFVSGLYASQFLQEIANNATFPISFAQENSWNLTNVSSAIKLSLSAVKQDQDIILDLLSKTFCDDIPLENSTETYSGGQKMRISLSRALNFKGIIIIDSQLTSLDKQLRQKIINNLRKFVQQQNSIILIKGQSSVCDGHIIVNENQVLIQHNEQQFKNKLEYKYGDKQAILSSLHKKQKIKCDKKIAQQDLDSSKIKNKVSWNTYKLYFVSYWHIYFMISLVAVTIVKHGYNYYINKMQTINNHQAHQYSIHMMQILCIYIIAIFFRSYLFALANLKQAQRIGNKINTTIIMNDISFYTTQEQIQTKKQSYTSQKLIHLATSDLESISYNFSFTTNILFNNIMEVLASVIIMVYEVPILIIFLLGFVIMIKNMDQNYRHQNQALQHEIKQQEVKVLKSINDLQLGRKVLKAYKKQRIFIQEYIKCLDQLIEKQKKMFQLSIQISSTYRFSVVIFMMVGIFLYVKFGHHNDNISGFSILVNYALVLSNYLLYLTMSLADTQNKAVSIERVRQILQSKQPQRIKQSSNILQKIKKKISYIDTSNFHQKNLMDIRNLNFQYNPGRPILKNVNIQLNQGEKMHLSGRSGAGKTTFFKILTQLYNRQVYQGLKLNEIHVSLSPQHPLLLPNQKQLIKNIDPYNILPHCRRQFQVSFMNQLNKNFQNSSVEELSYKKQLLINNFRGYLYGINGITIYDQPQQIITFNEAKQTYIVVSHHKIFKATKKYMIKDGQFIRQ